MVRLTVLQAGGRAGAIARGQAGGRAWDLAQGQEAAARGASEQARRSCPSGIFAGLFRLFAGMAQGKKA